MLAKIPQSQRNTRKYIFLRKPYCVEDKCSNTFSNFNSRPTSKSYSRSFRWSRTLDGASFSMVIK